MYNMKHEIIKEFNDSSNVCVIRCTEGCKITSWKEGDKIEDYNSFTFAYCPKNTDLSIYRCISIEEDEAIVERQKEAYEAAMN